MQRRDGYGTLAPAGAAETLLARRIAVMFGLTILLVGGTLAVRQRALRQAGEMRELLSIGSAEVVQPESPEPGHKLVVVEVQVAPTGADEAGVRVEQIAEQVRLHSDDGRQVYTARSGEKDVSMFEPVEEVGAEPGQHARLIFEVPESFRSGKVFYWGGEVGRVALDDS